MVGRPRTLKGLQRWEMGAWGEDLAHSCSESLHLQASLPPLLQQPRGFPVAPAAASPAHHSQMWLALESARLPVKDRTRRDDYRMGRRVLPWPGTPLLGLGHIQHLPGSSRFCQTSLGTELSPDINLGRASYPLSHCVEPWFWWGCMAGHGWDSTE